jgi:hypothetical protein
MYDCPWDIHNIYALYLVLKIECDNKPKGGLHEEQSSRGACGCRAAAAQERARIGTWSRWQLGAYGAAAE